MTTYLHYLPRGVPAPAIGTKRQVGSENNRLWQRKLEPWQTSGMYPIRQSDIDWADEHGYDREPFLNAWRSRRQEIDVRQEEIFEAHRPAHLPSRQRCMYLWDDRDGYATDARSMGVDPAAQALIRIRPVLEDSTVHRVPLDALEY